MPLELVKVERVESSSPPFTVYGETVEDVPKPLKVHTWDALKASACQRAHATHRYVWIAWRDRRFGECDIVSVKLDDSTFSDDDTPRERWIR